MKLAQKNTHGGKAENVPRCFLKIKHLIDDEVSIGIGGSETLPAPLTPQEEAALLARLGTDEGVKTTLIEHNLRLVVYIARKFGEYKCGDRGFDFDLKHWAD